MLSDDPKVSVVIPTFNRAYCIGRTIDSVLSQTHGNLEIIVVDDGSSDGTGELIKSRYLDEPRVKYIFQQNNGVCAARNAGFLAATGEFVALLDSDDAWYSWKIEAQLACFEKFPAAGMVWTDMDAVSDEGTALHRRFLRTMYGAYKWFPTPDALFSQSAPISDLLRLEISDPEDARIYFGDIFSEMIVGNLVHTSTVLIRRSRLEQVGGFNEELRHSGEDYDFHLRTCSFGPVAFLDIPAIRYRWGAKDQLTGDAYKIHRARNFIKTIGPILKRDRARIHLPPAVLRATLSGGYGYVGEAALDIGNRTEAAVNILRSLYYNPAQPRLAALLVLTVLPVAAIASVRGAYGRLKELLGTRASTG